MKQYNVFNLYFPLNSIQSCSTEFHLRLALNWENFAAASTVRNIRSNLPAYFFYGNYKQFQHTSYSNPQACQHHYCTLRSILSTGRSMKMPPNLFLTLALICSRYVTASSRSCSMVSIVSTISIRSSLIHFTGLSIRALTLDSSKIGFKLFCSSISVPKI